MKNFRADLIRFGDRIKNRNIYRDYKDFMKRYISLGEDLSYNKRMEDVIEAIAVDYAEMQIPESKMIYVPSSPEELDTIAKEKISPYFKGSSHFIFRNMISKKIIDPTIPIDMSDLLNREVYLQKYETADDLIAAIYQIIHIIAYQGDKRMVYLETFPQAFKLIVADILDEMVDDGNFVDCTMKNQIMELVYNIYINYLYPSITPILMPYSVGLYLANEIYLNYKNNPEKFVEGFNAVTSKEISTEDYLKSIGADMSLENVEKIKEHHQIILK